MMSEGLQISMYRSNNLGSFDLTMHKFLNEEIESVHERGNSTPSLFFPFFLSCIR